MIWNYLSAASLPFFLRRLSHLQEKMPQPLSPLVERMEGNVCCAV